MCDTPTKRPRAMGRIIASVIVGVVAVVAVVIVAHDKTECGEKNERRARRIAEVKPTIPNSAKTNDVVKVDEESPDPQKVGEIKNGKIRLANGKIHVMHGIVTNTSGMAKLKCDIFTHKSENVIARLLTIKPGQFLVGTPHYNGRITKDFLESLKEPIIISPDDSDYDKELKRAVREAKVELKIAYDNGEDIEKILLDSRAEFQKLGRYKEELRRMTTKQLSAASTPEEVDDYIKAANVMLEQKGIAPMNPTPFERIKLRLQEQLQKGDK